MEIPAMLLRRTFALVFCLAATLAAQSSEFFFVQLADPQFGMFDNDRGYTTESGLYEAAVTHINRLKPKFVVICGDLINKPGDAAQTAEFLRITRQIDKSIPVFAVPGNHDVGNEPTPELLAYYREQIGPDYYSFLLGGLYGIVLNSSLISAPQNAPLAAEAQEIWLSSELERARASQATHIVVFQHHPWFLESAEEPSQYFNIPLETRRRYLNLLRSAGVQYVFAGHYHRNALGRDAGLEMVTTGPVGRPLGDDPSGLRIVSVTPHGLSHQYYALDQVPGPR
jgi:3',5'-cyclic AMP phosphodiesterase CpdA